MIECNRGKRVTGKVLFLTAILLLCLSTAVNARGKSEMGEGVHIFRYGNSQPENHPRSQSMIYFKELVEKRSGGKIQVENYFSAVLGNEREMMDMVAAGSLQGTRGGMFVDANVKYNIFLLPFLVSNWDEALRLMYSPYAEMINEGAKEQGFHIPACGISQGFRAHTNNVRPIETPEDLKGLKLRVPQMEIYTVTARVLGAVPQEMPYTDVYTALKTGMLDGQDNALSNIWDYRVYEVQKYLSITNYGTGPDPFIVNLDWYKSLPDDLKAIFDQSAVEAIKYSDKLNRESEEEYLKKLEGMLETNFVTAANLEKLREATRSVYQNFVDKGYFTWDDVLEAQAYARGEKK